jgi:hypothetical protein
MYRNILILILSVFSGAVVSEEQSFLPPGGSAEYTNKETWLRECKNVEQYRIGVDIVACIIKQPDEKSFRLVMSYANDFTKSELGKMLDGKLNPKLPPRNHSRFKCLRLTSGWIC